MQNRIWNGLSSIILTLAGKDLYPKSSVDEFRDAMFSGNEAEVLRLLENGQSANEIENGYLALFVAIEGGSYAVVRLLLEHGADVNSADQYGFTPLHLAVENTVDENGDDYILADEEEIDIVVCLLEAGANVSLLTERGESPIDFAEQYGFDELTSLLRSYA